MWTHDGTEVLKIPDHHRQACLHAPAQAQNALLWTQARTDGGHAADGRLSQRLRRAGSAMRALLPGLQGHERRCCCAGWQHGRCHGDQLVAAGHAQVLTAGPRMLRNTARGFATALERCLGTQA